MQREPTTKNSRSTIKGWELNAGSHLCISCIFLRVLHVFSFFPRCFPCFSVFLHFPVLHFRLPSGKRLRKTMENHHFSWENSLFLWPFSIVMLVYQRLRFSPNPSTFSPRFPMAQRPTATTHHDLRDVGVLSRHRRAGTELLGQEPRDAPPGVFRGALSVPGDFMISMVIRGG